MNDKERHSRLALEIVAEVWDRYCESTNESVSLYVTGEGGELTLSDKAKDLYLFVSKKLADPKIITSINLLRS